MEIDLFTVIAQIINFLVLVWLLKKFLYQKVLDILEERKRLVMKQIAEAEEKAKKAEEMSKSYDKRLKSLEEETEKVLRLTKQEADAEKQAILERARADAEENRMAWIRSLNSEKQAFIDTLTDIVSSKINDLTGTIFRQLTGKELQSQTFNIFLEKIKILESAKIAKLNGLIADGGGLLIITTALPISDDLKEVFQQQLRENGVVFSGVRFQLEESLILGAEIRAGSMLVSWSVRDYLQDFKEILQTTLERNADK